MMKMPCPLPLPRIASEKRTSTHITLMTGQFAVLYFVKFGAASKCRRLNNFSFFCACFTTADIIIREHFNAAQVPFDEFFFKMGGTHTRLFQCTSVITKKT
jgi:hypothetical protein